VVNLPAGQSRRVSDPRIAAFCAVTTNCVVLKGAVLPPRSRLAANATLIKAKDHDLGSGIYAGTPANCIAPAPSGRYVVRSKDKRYHKTENRPPWTGGLARAEIGES
jgi:acetyltransferase-like isoleucine patch superfamily enzyme